MSAFAFWALVGLAFAGVLRLYESDTLRRVVSWALTWVIGLLIRLYIID